MLKKICFVNYRNTNGVQTMFLKSFTAFAIAIIRSRTAVPVWATTAKFGVGFALGLICTINLVRFWTTRASSLTSIFQSPPLLWSKPIRWFFFEIHASLTVTEISSLTAIVAVRTAIRILVVWIAGGKHTVDFRYLSTTPTYINTYISKIILSRQFYTCKQ